jgi:serine/threonine protein kinase
MEPLYIVRTAAAVVYIKPCEPPEAAAIARLRHCPALPDAISGTAEDCCKWAHVDCPLPKHTLVVVTLHPGPDYILGHDWTTIPKSVPHMAAVLAALFAALAQIHARGVTHNDLHAKNWLVNSAAEVVIIDFGAATLQNGINHDNATVYDPMLDIGELLWHALCSLNIARPLRRALKHAAGAEHVVGPHLKHLAGTWGAAPGCLTDGRNGPFYPNSTKVLTRYNNNRPLFPAVVLTDNPGCPPGTFLGLAVAPQDYEPSKSPTRPPQADWINTPAVLALLAHTCAQHVPL